MKIERVWAMPDRWTFNIEPILHLIHRYIGDGKGWLDPFAGFNSPAEFTNDINPEARAKYHLNAIEFIDLMQGKGLYKGCLFDPPYSINQVFASYRQHGKEEFIRDDKTGGFIKVKDMIAKMIEPGGHTIFFGWNTNAFGINRGFEIREILLVAHGGMHNDTLVTVEQKTQAELF